MPNKYITSVIEAVSGPLEDLEQRRCDIVIVRLAITRKEIKGLIRVGHEKEDKEDEH